MYYHESFAHVVWLGDAVVAFRVLAEAEEDGVDGHLVDPDEAGRRQVSEYGSQAHRRPDVLNWLVSQLEKLGW